MAVPLNPFPGIDIQIGNVTVRADKGSRAFEVWINNERIRARRVTIEVDMNEVPRVEIDMNPLESEPVS